jgi:hydrogenase expression/formation protein HypC
MCLAIPMKIIEVGSDMMGKAEIDGNAQDINLAFIEDPKVGDYVIIHAGFAIERLNVEEADKQIKLFAELNLVMQDELKSMRDRAKK